MPPQTPFDTLTLDLSGAVAHLTLNRPPHNILTLASIQELSRALATLAADPRLKAIVLSANGRSFCAGVDVADHTPERVEPMIRAFSQLCAQLRTHPVPTIAVVRGRALGGGTELAIACDQVLAAASAQFGQPEITLGVFPPVAAAIFPRLIGYQQAARLVLTGEILSAAQATQLGLITQFVPDDELPIALERLLTQLSGLSAAVLRLTKRALLLGDDLGPARALPPIEDLYLTSLMATADAREGIQSFLDKRPPHWTDQ